MGSGKHDGGLLRCGRAADPANASIGHLAESIRELSSMVLEMAEIDQLVLQFGHLVP
jgi:hypothetical protein